jgi:hypothetical protein
LPSVPALPLVPAVPVAPALNSKTLQRRNRGRTLRQLQRDRAAWIGPGHPVACRAAASSTTHACEQAQFVTVHASAGTLA